MTSFLRTFFLALTCASLALIPSACNRYTSGDSHQIGHVAPRTGPDQVAGKKLIDAVAMVVDETNHDEPNRIEQRQITVIHADTGSAVNGFTFQTTRLLTINRVVGLLGGVNTTQLAKMVEALNGQPFAPVTVSPCGGLAASPNKWVWCVGISPAERGKYLAKEAVEQAKVGEIVTVTDTRDPVFAAIRAGFEAEFRHPDRKVTSALTFADVEHLPGLAAKLGDATTKAILFCGRADDLLKLRGELAAKKLAEGVPILFGGEEEEAAFRKEPDRGNGIFYVSAFFTEDKTEGVDGFVTSFRTRAGQAPDADAMLSADAARILFTAARSAKKFSIDKTSRDNLARELGKLELMLPTGKFWYSKEGEPRRTAYVLRLEGGSPKLLAKLVPEAK